MQVASFGQAHAGLVVRKNWPTLKKDAPAHKHASSDEKMKMLPMDFRVHCSSLTLFGAVFAWANCLVASRWECSFSSEEGPLTSWVLR